jgi:TRAPP trafficking subunit Trs65
VEAHAVGQQAVKQQDASQPPQLRETKELLVSETIGVTDDPMICATEIQAEGDSEPSQHIYIFWRVTIPIGRPRARLQKLAIFFTPTAVLKPFPISGAFAPETADEYLSSGTPLSMNILAALSNDAKLGKAYLSSSRFARQPSSDKQAQQHQHLNRPIRSGPRKLFRAAPPLLWRIRFLRFPALAEKDTILACFDTEITSFANCPVSIDKINLMLSSGYAEPVGVELPVLGNPGEQMTLIYKLLPPSDFSNRFTLVESNMSNDPLANRTLTVTLSASVLMSEECTAKVKIKWKTALEMPASRPGSRSDNYNGNMTGQPTAWSGAQGPRFGESLALAGRVYDVPDFGPAISHGVSLSITAPDKVHVGQLFRWEVLVINRSDQLQRFAIVPIPKRKPVVDMNFIRPESSGSNTGRGPAGTGTKKAPSSLAAPWVDENALFSTQKGATMEASDLICLSPDVRVG